MEETLRTLDQFVRAGKIRYWGLSNFTGWQLTKAVHLARALNVAGPVTLQPQYSLLARETEWEIVPAASDPGLGLLPWSPLGGGWLSGKYRRAARPAGATRPRASIEMARWASSSGRAGRSRAAEPASLTHARAVRPALRVFLVRCDCWLWGRGRARAAGRGWPPVPAAEQRDRGRDEQGADK